MNGVSLVCTIQSMNIDDSHFYHSSHSYHVIYRTIAIGGEGVTVRAVALVKELVDQFI